MKLKLNKDGSAVVRNGMPVYVLPNGAEKEIDGGAAWGLLLTKHFESSPTMGRLKIPADVAASFFGPSFTIADGRLVAQDKHGIQLYSSIKHGEAAGFDEAFGKLVDGYHSKDMILREGGAPSAPGGGGAAPAGQPGAGRAATRQQFEAMNPQQRAQHVRNGGTVVDGTSTPAPTAPAHGAKVVNRQQFEQMSPIDRAAHCKAGGTIEG